MKSLILNKMNFTGVAIVTVFLGIAVFSNTAVFAQVNVISDLKSGENSIHLQDALIADSNGDLILEMREKEIIELTPTSGNATNLVLMSGDASKFQVVNNKFLIGIEKTTTPIDLTGTINGNAVNLNGRSKIKIVVVTNNTDENINSDPTFLSYKVVKDAFGRRIAEYYLVIQVNIQNNNSNKRFLVQDVSVAFDPKQCRVMELYFTRINSSYATQFDENKCVQNYVDYFGYPMNISPIERETILAAANTEKYRSKRYQVFKALKFIADVGGGLTTFKLLGRDGISAFGFLGGTIFNSLDTALPKVSDEKRTFLEKNVPQENVIVNANDAKKLNIFIPADRVFTNETWRTYKKSVKKKPKPNVLIEPLEFRRYIQLFMIATSKGVLIDSNSKTTDSKGGGAKSVIDRINQTP